MTLAGAEPVTVAAAEYAQRTQWWSFQPVIRPKVDLPTASTNPVDYFIRAKLGELKLAPSPEADRRTLIRRVNYDLIGLPPTPGEVDQFESDAGSDAYERMVDRLLASPRYGERWARHWLDLVHFGETHGYDKDKLRPNAWPYRDYVIRAFNQDKHYARFIEEQLAGDELFPDEPDGVVALGFLAAGPWDYVGHVELPISKTDGLIARYNDRDDMVMTTLSTFQSLTVHCARCHNHKFDPITQEDYYHLQAVFAGVDRADRPYDADPEVYRKRRAMFAEQMLLKVRQAELERVRTNATSPELRSVDERLTRVRQDLGTEGGGEKSPSNGYHSAIETSRDRVKWVQIDLGRTVSLSQLRLVPARPTDFADTPGFGFPMRFKVEVSEDNAFETPLVLLDFTGQDYKNPGDAAVAIEAAGRRVRCVRITTTRLWERSKDYVFALAEVQAFADGTNAARAATVTAVDSIESGRWSKSNLVDGFDSRSRLDDAEPTAAVLARRRSLETEIQALLKARAAIVDELLGLAWKTESETVSARLAGLEKELAALPPPLLVYAAAHEFKGEGNFVPPRGMRPVHVLARGDVKRPGDEAMPAALPAVPGPEWKCASTETGREGARRAALAHWLTDSRNLLTRRSLVNRIWQYHFGRGLVETPNDFGHMGGLPSHPELLDWLAYWFLDHGESIKQLHRLLVTSATYRQSSANRPEAARVDADNRYLWRMNRSRLDAESIRDAMLLISGRLDLRMGGPSDRQFFFKDDHSPVYDYTRFDIETPAACRRSIYRHLVRSVPDPLMECLDAADASQLVARRYTTLTALQALATLNNPFVLSQCEHLAKRLAELSPELPGQIEWACRWCLARKPTAEELTQFREYGQRRGLASLCRVLFNTSEFVFLD